MERTKISIYYQVFENKYFDSYLCSDGISVFQTLKECFMSQKLDTPFPSSFMLFLSSYNVSVYFERLRFSFSFVLCNRLSSVFGRKREREGGGR